MTWTVLKYNVDDLKREPSNEADPVKEAHKDPLLEDRAKEIEEYVKNYRLKSCVQVEEEELSTLHPSQWLKRKVWR